MATTPQLQNRRETVDFTPNLPITLALKYAQGKIVSSQFGERVMYTTTDNRVLFLDPYVANKIEELGINVRENITITKCWDGIKGSQMTWHVARAVGEQPDGTLVLPKPPTTASQSMPNVSTERPLVTEAKALVDDFAEVLSYGLRKHEGRIKPEEIRSLLISAYIQRQKFASCA